jgi:serine protease Do
MYGMKRNAVAWAALVMSAAALVSSRGLMKSAPALQEVPAEGQKVARALSDAFGAVAEFAKPSVVQIGVQRKVGSGLRLPTPGRRSPLPGPGMPPGDLDDLEEMLKRFFPGFKFEKEQFGFRMEGTGSGFVYDDKGHILTNSHVVADAQKIEVTFHDGTTAVATVVGNDPETDVAVIKVENTSYRPLPKGQSKNLRVGEWILALGSPFGLSQSVTAGIISATGRDSLGILGEKGYENFIQTDAAINPGNSGGPLIDMNGRVIGINTAIVTRSQSNAGVGFAIPIDMATLVADRLIKDGKINRARLGCVLQTLTPAMARQFGLERGTTGVLVTNVLAGSPAEKAGLRPGDVITAFEGNPVANMQTFRYRVANSDIGKAYRLSFMREGKERQANVVLAPATEIDARFERERPEVAERAEGGPATKLDEFGLEVKPVNPELAAQQGYPEDTEGLIISAVKEGSPAEAAGLSVGNLITKVVRNQKIQAVKDPKDFKALADKADELALYVQSSNQPGRFITLSKAKKD